MEEYKDLNGAELSELVRKKTGRRVDKRDRDSLLAILNGNKLPETNEESSRKKLQIFVEANITSLATNLPCIGETLAGKCTKHKCTTITHLSCLKGAESFLNESNNTKSS